MALPSSSIFRNNDVFNVSSPGTNTTASGTNPYTNLNVMQDPNKVTNAANTLAGTLDPSIQGLKDLSTVKTDTSGAPDTSLQGARDKISNIAASGVTKESMDKYSSLRPKNEFEGQLSTAVSRLGDYSAGTSKIDQTLANRYLTKFDASSAAANMAQSQRIASNPYLTAGAKNAALSELNRTSASQRSELVGGLAEKAQERAYAATKDYANMTLQAAEFKENQYRTDLAAATQDVTNNLNAAIAAGNLNAQEISNNINVWNTKVNSQIQDLNRSLSALVSSGQLTSEQAQMKLNGVMEASRIEQQNITNELNKARGIADWQAQQTNDEVAKAQIKQIDAALEQQIVENYKTWNGLATSAILDYRTKNQGTTADDWEDASQDANVRMYMNNVWKNIPGNENVPMDETWAASYYKSINTAAETTKQATEAKINSLRSTWVGTNPGQMTAEAFDNVANTMRMVSDFGGSVSMSADGTVSIVGADGKPMMDSSGNAYSWDKDGNRVKVTTTPGTSIKDFNNWKSENLLSSDTADYTDTQVFDAYNKLISEGKTPNRTNIMEALNTSGEGTTKSKVSTADYDKITTKIDDSGANPGYLTFGTDMFDQTMSIRSSDIKKIIDFEKANPDKREYTVDFDFANIPENQKRFLRDGHNATWYDFRDAMTNNMGKIINLNGKPIVSMGLANYDEFRYYDVETGKIENKRIDDIIQSTKDAKLPDIDTVETKTERKTTSQTGR